MASLSEQEDVPPEDEEREFLLLPGVNATQVVSGFSDVRVNRMCKIVLRLAFYFFIFQLVVLIVDFSFLMSKGEEATAAVGLLRLIGIAATLYLGYTGIKYKNQEWLCGLTFLHAYLLIMYLMLLFSGLEFVVVFLLLATTKTFYVYQFILTMIHLVFQVASIFKYLPNLTAETPTSSSVASDNL